MIPDRLDLLYVTLFPPSPATFGAQRRIEGLMRALSRKHRVTGVSLYGPVYDPEVARKAMAEYCDQVVLVPGRPERGAPKRLLQLRSLFSPHSFEYHQLDVPALQRALDATLRARRYHAVSVEAPFLFHYHYDRAPHGQPRPLVILDEHNIEHDLARQSRDAAEGFLRRLHHGTNWRKVRHEEIVAWKKSDGVAFTSREDAERARAILPRLHAEVVPNAVDVDFFRPRPDLPPADGQTFVFFGTGGYYPNQDGMAWFLREIWPVLEKSHPQAKVKVIGADPSPEVLAARGPRVEATGLVDDLRPHLAGAAAVIVPLRVGGGTRFKILEAMAMGKPVVSTTLGAEGIGAVSEENILLADTPADFARAAGRLLDDAALAAKLAAAGRARVEALYSWEAAAGALERLLLGLLERQAAGAAGAAGTGGSAAVSGAGIV
jgi:glycosyltransferase involved in cell wall biosynthesis